MLRGPVGPFQVEIAVTRRERRRGLLGRRSLSPGTGMLFPGARSVHTIGMRFPIAVIFLDRGERVLAARVLRPNRLARHRRAAHVVEVRADEVVPDGATLEGAAAAARRGLSRAAGGARARPPRRARRRRR